MRLKLIYRIGIQDINTFIRTEEATLHPQASFNSSQRNSPTFQAYTTGGHRVSSSRDQHALLLTARFSGLTPLSRVVVMNMAHMEGAAYPCWSDLAVGILAPSKGISTA